MDSAKLQKKQSLKVIISEAIMVLAVIITVSILALIVSGYWVNSNFEVERNGMLQVSSIPSGANLEIDGESSWLQRTNTSKVLGSGEHSIVLTKEGYDSWSRTINISEGLLYRLHYPRLFLQNRESESVLNNTGAIFATISPDSGKLLSVGDTTEWSLFNLNDETLKPKKLDISEYFSSTSLASDAKVGLFTGKILTADWDRSNSHVLLQVQTDNNTEWVLLDVNNIKNSLNLTKEFGANFSKVKILDNSASNLLAVKDGNLHKIDVPGKLISSVLIKDITDFDHYEDEIVFVALADTDKYTLGLTKVGSDKVTELGSFTKPLKATISKFYDDMYITTLQDAELVLYKKDDFAKVSNFQLSFEPATIEVGHNGEFITAFSGPTIATLDMEASSVREWAVEGETFDWLDDDMTYTVNGGELVVYDFDGLNRRSLAKNVSSHFPITITDNKWLYYFSDNQLIREWLVQR